jgi:hypothetical protein
MVLNIPTLLHQIRRASRLLRRREPGHAGDVNSKLKSLAAIVVGVALAAGAVSLWAAPEAPGRFRCAWSETHCISTDRGGERKLELASLERVNVANSRARGNSLELVTSHGTEILAGPTLHAGSRREYYAAATAINALLRHRADSVDVSFTYRPGVMPGLMLMGVGLLSALLGVRSFWAR